LSRDALARAKAQMDEESMGVRDEIGFLTIHQGYADRFFPGTSVLHTRARYLLLSRGCSKTWRRPQVQPHSGPCGRGSWYWLAGCGISRGKMSPIAVARLAV
jgi:hypothetical protein